MSVLGEPRFVVAAEPSSGWVEHGITRCLIATDGMLPSLATRVPDPGYLFGQQPMLRPLELAIALEQANGLVAGHLQKSHV
jgi:hypothetical protein